VKALYEQDMDVMLGDDINKLLEGGYLLCQDCMGHLLPDSGDIHILEINIDMFLYYIILYIYIYIGTKMDKNPWQRKNQTQEVWICIDTQNEESCSIMWTI
jgi:hypothetical protein